MDVRIISATNRDLLKEIEENRFRNDLFYRLNVVQIHIPALRERRRDISLLAEYFLKRLSRAMRKTVAGISAEAMRVLETYEWPGNVRELKNVMERAIVVCEGDTVGRQHLLLGQSPVNGNPRPSENGSLAEMEKGEILRVLRECNGNRSRAARALGINRKTLREKIRKYGITLEE